jgi:hypothetical protein
MFSMRGRIPIAFFFHAPGLWLLYRLRIGPQTQRQNVIAIALTLMAMAIVHVLTHDVFAVGLAWLAGHAAWGTWLAARVSRDLTSR